jgi:folylpolyglutamate synthase/dihydropteroate synthase
MRAFCDGVAPFIQGKKTLLTLGMLRDKDLRGMLRIAMELGADLAVSEPDNPRKATAQELHEVLAELGGSAIITGDAKCAYAYAMAHADDYDCFLYAGSLYFISAIREQYRLREDAE